MKYIVIIIFLFNIYLKAQVSLDWHQRYNGTSNGSDQPYCLTLDASGNLYVSGISSGTGTGNDIVTIKYNPDNGETIWSNRYNGPLNDQVNAINCDNNAVYITGWTFNPGRDIITIKYDAVTGNRLWVKTYNGTGNGGDYGLAIARDAAGNIFTAGRSDISGAQKFTILKYDHNGNLLPGWPSVYTGSYSTAFDEAHAIITDALGNVYVTGRSGSAGASDYLTLKINSTGLNQWAKKYNGNNNDEDNAVAIVIDNADENIFVGGYSIRTGSFMDYCIIKYNTLNGDSITSAIYNNSPVNYNDILTSMTIDNLNNVYVTGYSFGNPGTYDFATLKYNSSCTQLWVSRYDGPGHGFDLTPYIATDWLGNVYISGRSAGSTSLYDFATIMYNSSGFEQWIQRYNGPGNADDISSSIAVDENGNVFVTGWSTGILTGTFDFATIKYRQIPDPPSELAASADYIRSIHLSWTDNSGNETGFKVERSSDAGINWGLIASLTYNSTSYIDTGLIPFSIYHYRVQSFNQFGNSSYSNTAYDTALSSNPVMNISVLISMVNSLKNTGVLNEGQANSLVVKLNAAEEKFLQGKYKAAINQINAFINHVNAFINGMILTPQQGLPLINIANYIIELINQTDSNIVIKNRSTEIPNEFALYNNYPNPFNPNTNIRFDNAKTTHTSLIVYDILGREVLKLINKFLKPGKYEAEFDGTNYPSGIYFYKLDTEYYTNTKKMVLIK